MSLPHGLMLILALHALSRPAAGGQSIASRSTLADRDRVFALAYELPDYAGAWVDDRGAADRSLETAVVNVQVAGSVTVAEQRLRTRGVDRCGVSKAADTRKELNRVLDTELSRAGFLSGGASRGALFISVV